MAEAMHWVSRITTVGVGMVLPGIVGQWADTYFKTTFLRPLGFIFGLVFAGYQLFRIATESQSSGSKRSPRSKDRSKISDSDDRSDQS